MHLAGDLLRDDATQRPTQQVHRAIGREIGNAVAILGGERAQIAGGRVFRAQQRRLQRIERMPRQPRREPRRQPAVTPAQPTGRRQRKDRRAGARGQPQHRRKPVIGAVFAGRGGDAGGEIGQNRRLENLPQTGIGAGFLLDAQRQAHGAQAVAPGAEEIGRRVRRGGQVEHLGVEPRQQVLGGAARGGMRLCRIGGVGAGGGQGAAVDLTAWGQRQRRKRDQRTGLHRGGQRRAQGRAERIAGSLRALLPLLLRHEPEHQLRRIAAAMQPGDHLTGQPAARCGGFDLGQFDAHTAQLDLPVAAPQKNQRATPRRCRRCHTGARRGGTDRGGRQRRSGRADRDSRAPVAPRRSSAAPARHRAPDARAGRADKAGCSRPGGQSGR